MPSRKRDRRDDDDEASLLEVPQWEELAQSQQGVTMEHIMNSRGRLFALQDRNTILENWRPIFVQRSLNNPGIMLVVNSLGAPIDEPSCGVANGHQDIESFADDADSEMYYRIPKIRSAPRERNVAAFMEAERRKRVRKQASPATDVTPQNELTTGDATSIDEGEERDILLDLIEVCERNHTLISAQIYSPSK